MDTLQRRKLEKQKKLEEQIVQEQQLTYQVVLDYLLEEGFASTEKSADSIILNMSEAWFQHIIDEDDKSYDRNRKRAAQRAAARLDENRAAMGRIAREYKKRKEEEGMKKRMADHADKMKNDPEYAAKRRAQDKIHREELELDEKGTVRHKSGAKNEEFINEEDYDRMKDRQMERGTFRPRSKPYVARSGGTQPNTFGKKKPEYDGMSAVEKVKAAIEKQYGKGAIVDTKKKKK